MRILASIMALLMMLAASLPAWGQSAEDQFLQAQKLFDNGKYQDALPLFQGAFAVTGSPNARLMLARTLAKLEQWVEAYDEMRAAVDDAAARAKDEPRYVETRDAAAAEIALLEKKVGKLIVAIPDDELAMRVVLDDQELADTKLNSPITVLPGSHRVKATAEGMDDFEREIDIRGGDTKTVAVKLETAQAPDEPVKDEESGFELDPVRAAGIAAVGLGVVGMIAFAVTGSMAKSRHDQLEEECGAVRCVDPTYADVVDEGKKLQLGANVSAGLGAAFLAAGAIMIIVGGPSDETAATAAIVPLPGGALLSASARF